MWWRQAPNVIGLRLTRPSQESQQGTNYLTKNTMTVTAKNSKIAHRSVRLLLGSFFITVMGGLFSYENTQNTAKFLSKGRKF